MADTTQKRPHGDGADATRKRRKKRKTHEEQDDLLDLENSVNTAFSVMDSQLLADYTVRMTAKSGGDLSAVELSDLALPAMTIWDTSGWDGARTLDGLPAFLDRHGAAQAEVGAEAKGAPHTLIVTGAALRATDIVRVARKVAGKGSVVAKLFAKHMKVSDQVKFLQSSRTSIGVGVPSRLAQLIDNGALRLNNLTRLVIDASHIDQKKRGIMDMKETMLPLVHFLSRADIRARYADEATPLRVLFF